MADYLLERSFWLPRPRAEVFHFFADPRNLALVQPPGTHLQWLSEPPAVGAAADPRLGQLAGQALDLGWPRCRALRAVNGLPQRRALQPGFCLSHADLDAGQDALLESLMSPLTEAVD